jgi:two-component system NtrC family sensor kinase
MPPIKFLNRFRYRTQHFPKLTIKQRIIFGFVTQAIMIAVIGVFVYISFNNILSELRSIERINGVNIAILEMRKDEKNYLLYNDQNALNELAKLGETIHKTILSSKSDLALILPEKSSKNYDQFLEILQKYRSLANEVITTKALPKDFEGRFRLLGHELTSISEQLLKQQRESTGRTITNYAIMFMAFLGIMFFFQLILWKYFFSLIITELDIIRRTIKRVSEGRFGEITTEITTPRNEIEIAIKAFTDCATKLEKREAEMKQTVKLASLGVLISGVAHELGNPLTNISMLAQTYLNAHDMLDNDEKMIYMEDVYNQTERIQKIVRNLLEFSRQMKLELQEWDIGEIVDVVLSLVTNQLMISNVKPHLSIADGLPPVYVDASQIEQVLVNLFINAIQAMPEGGDLFVSASFDPQSDRIILEIRDTGIGINKENLPHVFDPFFSTKGTKGTGLGLSVSYGIIRQHHGDITVESEEGKGTSFIIKLPPMNT